jgi:hypothetical protein
MTSPASSGGIVSRAIILNVKLSVHARHLYAVLCCVADDRREIERSKPELIEDSGLSRATIHRAMAELVEAGIVEVRPSVNSDGGTRTNRYCLQEGGLTQTLPPSLTEPPGVSEGDPLQGSAGQTPVSEGDPPGSQTETGEGVSEGDPGSFLYKKGEGETYNPSPSVTSPCSDKPTTTIRPEPDSADPAPEDDRPMAMLDFNRIPIPTEDTRVVAKEKRSRTRLKYDYDEPFLAAWEAYGRVGGKRQAWEAWKNANGRASIDTIMAAIPHYLASDGPQRGYTKHFSTWLNDDGWESAEAQPKKKGYQGRAGSDVKSQEGAEERVRRRPVCKLMRSGPMPGDLGWNRAWYFHWNVEQQRHWTREQLLETGNSSEDVDWLMQAYAHGVDSDLYQRLLADIEGTDAR